MDFDLFLQYFANLSSAVENDEDFAEIIISIWDLKDFAPPPPMLKVRKGREVVTPLALQAHGDLITWQQEQSNIEGIEIKREQQKGRKVWNAVNVEILFISLFSLWKRK